MGDTKSWLIFFAGVLAVSLFALALLTSAIVGLYHYFSRRVANDGQDKSLKKSPKFEVSAECRQDNRFQAVVILIVVALCAPIGVAFSLLNSSLGIHWVGGVLLGAFAGLIVGLVVSGAMVMVLRYRRSSGS